ncbi:MAG: extracellular solute-binding protein [Minisyncoccia bacterium]
MSTFQIVVLSAFGTFAVAGVLIFAFLVGSNTSATIGEVVVWGTFDEAAFQTVLRQMAENDGRLRQVTYVQKNEDTYLTEITNALASGTGPDLFILRQDETVREAGKIFPVPYEQLSRENFRNLWVEAADPFLGPEGVMGIPFAVDPFVLYWNRDMLATGGIAKPPQYWEDMYEVTHAISKKTDAGTLTKSAIALGEYANVNHAKQILSMLIMQAGGRITGRDGAGTLMPSLTARTGETSQPGESALRFYTQFSNPSTQDYSWNRSLPESRVAFAQGDLALYIGPASEEPLVRRLNPNLNFAIATSVPQIKNSTRTVDTGYAYAFAIPRASPNRQGALTAAFLLAGTEGSQSFSLAFGLASARRDILDSVIGCDACLKSPGSCAAQIEAQCRAMQIQGNDVVFSRMALLVRTWEDPDPDETERIFRDMIESVTSGAARTVEAVQRAEQAMRQLTTQ